MKTLRCIVAVTLAVLAPGCGDGATATAKTAPSDSAASADAAAGPDTASGADAAADVQTSVDTAPAADVPGVADGAVVDAVADAAAGDASALGADATAGSDVAAGQPIPIENLTDAMVGAVCKKMTTCGTADGVTFDTMEGCMSFATANIGEFQQLVDKVKAGKITYDPAKAGACLAAMADCTNLEQGEPPACKTTFVGQVADLAACDIKEECKSGRCDTQNNQCAGVCKPTLGPGGACLSDDDCQSGLSCGPESKCAAPKLAAEGQTCMDATECGPGLFCDGTMDVPKCKAMGVVGAACNNMNECKSGLFCKAGDAGGQCAAKGAIGTACDYIKAGESKTQPCVAGGVCVGTSVKASCIALSDVGGPCSEQAQCKGYDLTCALDPAGKGVCQLLPGKGGNCVAPDPMAGKIFTCQMPYLCIGGVCADLPVIGQGCGPMNQCANTATCDAKTKKCVDLPVAGQPCEGACKKGAQCNYDGGAGGVCQAVVCK